MLDAVRGLGGLGRDPEAVAGPEPGEVRLVQDHVVLGQILGQAPYFDMVPLPDDDRMEAVRDQGGDALVGEVNQGAGGLDDAMTATRDLGAASFRGAMGRDQDRVGLDSCEVAFEANAAAAEVVEDDRVVDEVTEDGEG